MGVNEGLAFWNAIKQKAKQLIKQETTNCFRLERYDVTSAPNGTTIGVTLPEGNTEINIPYSHEVSEAVVGDTVLVGWYGSLSTAKAVWYGKGFSGEPLIENIITSFTPKGSVATASALPSGATVGDMYTVSDEDNAQYYWDGTAWLNVTPTISTAQIDSLFE